MMSNEKNTLNPAFYKMMDFFLDKDKLQIQRLSNQGILGYEFGMEHLPDYNKWTMDEYEGWNDSLKFQFEIDTLHKHLPKGEGFYDFFGDIHLRIPHEQTLLIQENEKLVNMVSIKELPIKKYKDTLGTKTKAMRNTVDQYISAGVQEVYLCIASTYSTENKKKWSNIDEYDLIDLEAMTRPTCFLIPNYVILPAGLTIKETQTFARMQLILSNMTPLKDNSCYIDAIQSPYKSFGIKGKPLKWHFMNDERPNNFQKFTTVEHNFNRVFSAVSHMSVYSHPDFKDFCVKELKQKGLEPKKITYQTGRPFKKMNTKPKFEHYLLDLNIPTECDDHTTGKAGKKRFHLVRGHLMRTPDGGFTWRRSHWRGNRKLGVITKDYNIKVDRRIKNKTENFMRVNR